MWRKIKKKFKLNKLNLYVYEFVFLYYIRIRKFKNIYNFEEF